MESIDSKPHVILFSSPGLGHLIPVLELGKRLVTSHNCLVTIFVVASHKSPAESQVLQSAMTPKLCEIIELPPVDISRMVDHDTPIGVQLCVTMREIRPSLRSAISALKFRPAALVVDLFGTESLVIAKELGIRRYVFIASNALFVALQIYSPTLDKEVEGQYVDQKEMLKIPGCKPFPPEDVVDPMIDRTSADYFEYLRMGAEIPTSDGILMNIWEDLQPRTLAALKELLSRISKVPVFPIGPLLRKGGLSGSRSEVVDWLNKQPNESVVYVSFGSGGTITKEQMTELAWGLELSEQRFIWAVRPPAIKTEGSFLEAGKDTDDPLSYLPNGFLTRSKNVGLVVPQWAPQVEILSHRSVGGFLSHCGWNSTLESIANGVPMIAWPLYAEQRLNATLLAEEFGVAVRPRILPTKGVVGRKEIGVMIKRVLVDEEGIEMRNRVKKLKDRGEEALNKGGSSYNALSLVAKECEASAKSQKMKNP